MKHRIFRNGRLYDSLDPKTHAITQYVRSLLETHPKDTFSVNDENGECYYQVGSLTVPNHVYDWLKNNSPRAIPRDFVSLGKLIAQQGWTGVTADQIQRILETM